MATVSSLYVKILGDATGLQAALAKSSASLKGFGATASSTSAQASRSVVGMGAAFVGLAVAVKAASDFGKFESTMVRTVTLAGSTEAQMHSLSAEILDVSVALGKGPQELAEALYFTQSAGIDAADAMEVVTVAAKASAVGLGETQVVADALTSVLNAYGQENISAARAADILTAAVREGKGEADAIAGAIGRVIPIASEMGVEFEEVAAGIAAMTRTGLDAEEAATALRGALSAMLNPTVQANELLASVGLSTDALRVSIADRGLLATLTDLQQRFEGNSEAFGTLFGNIRAQTGVLSLLGSNAGEVAQVFRDVAASGGTVEEAFARVQETAEFKLQQALAAVEVAFIDVGGAIAPIVTGLAELLKAVAPLLPILVKLGAVILALKVMLLVPGWLKVLGDSFAIAATAALDAGRVFTATGSATAALGAASATAGPKVVALATSLGSVAIVLAPLIVIYKVLSGVIADANINLEEMAERTGLNAELLGFFRDRMSLAGKALEDSSFDGLIAGLDGIEENMETLIPVVQRLQTDLEGMGLSAASATNLMGFFGNAIDGSQEGLDKFDTLVQGGAEQIRVWADLVNSGKWSVEGFTHSLSVFGVAAADAALILDLAMIKQRAAVAKTSRELSLYRATLADGMPTLKAFAATVDTTSREIIDGMQEASLEGTAAVKAFISETLGALREWRAGVADSLTDVGGMLSELASTENLTAAQISTAFRKTAALARSFTADLVKIGETGGQTGKDLAAALLEMGPSAAGLADVVAGSGDKMRSQLVSDFGAILDAGKSGASKLADVLVAPLEEIRDILESIAKHFGVRVTADTSQASAALDGLRAKMLQLGIDPVQGNQGIPPVLFEASVHQGGLIAHDGGAVQRLHSGGQRLASDEVPAILQRGEFVIRRSAVAKIGVGALDAINRLHEGGAATGLGILERLGSTAPMRPAPAAAQITVAVAAPSPGPANVKLEVDRRRFTRSLDYDVLTDGYW